VYWWSFSVKYFMPAALVWIFFLGMKSDIDKAYGGYDAHWQIIGLIFVAIGLIIFLIPIIFASSKKPAATAAAAVAPKKEGDAVATSNGPAADQAADQAAPAGSEKA
jgi:hypothetical protein